MGGYQHSLLIYAGAELIYHWRPFMESTRQVALPSNWIFLLFSFAGLKLIHELWHGVAAKRYHAPTDGYRVQRVVFRFVSAECDGLPYQLTLLGNDGSTYEVSGDDLNVRNIRDRQPGPGVDMAGVARLRVRFPADNVDGLAFVIGGAATP